MCWNTHECRSVACWALAAIGKGWFALHWIRLWTLAVDWLLSIPSWAAPHLLMAISCLVAPRIKLIYVDGQTGLFCFPDCSGKLSCPTRLPGKLTDFPDVLNLAFVLLLELPPGVSSPFQYQWSRLKWEGCENRVGCVQEEGQGAGAWFVELWAVTGRKGWQLHTCWAFWQTYGWDGPSQDVSEADDGGSRSPLHRI